MCAQSYTALVLFTKYGSHFHLVATQSALFNYGNLKRGGSWTAESSMDLTTKGMNRVNGFQNR